MWGRRVPGFPTVPGWTRKAAGSLKEEYLYSVQITRDAWGALNFANLAAVDPVHALAMFDLRREMSKTGIFRGVEPHEGIQNEV